MSIDLLRLFGLGWVIAAPGAPIPVRIELDAPPGCSTAEAFYAGVRARTERVRRPAPGESALTLRVRLTRSGSSVHGELGGFDENGRTATRLVDGTSCDEVVEALSLTAALALDPNARFEPDPVPTGPDGRSAGGETESAATPAPPASERPQTAELEPQTSPDARRTPEPALSFQLALAGGLFAGRIVTHESNWGAAIGVRLEQRGSAFLSPSFGLAVLHLRNDVTGSSERVDVRWTTFALSACPVRVVAASGLALAPCALGLGGWLNAEGRSLSQPASIVRPWWSVGGALRGSAELESGLAIELEAGFTVPLVRRRFVTEIPDEFVGQTPRIAPLVGLGVVYAL